MKLIVCLPGNNFSGQFLDHFIAFYNWCIRNNIHIMVCRRESCNIYYVRNMCLGGSSTAGEDQTPWQGKVEYDYMLWIDSDIVFQIDDFIKLYNMKEDIASGLYLMQDGKHYATVENWDENYFVKHGSFEFLTSELINGRKNPFYVDYTGFGFILIKKGIFESLKYPWFRPLWKKFGSVTEFTMEDVSFCHMVKDLGYKVSVNPEVVVNHEKKILL